MKGFLALTAALLQGCIYLPRTETVYDEKCNVYARQMTLQAWQMERFPLSCNGKDCAYALAALGLIAAGSAVISGSVVVAGNAVYWAEKKCYALSESSHFATKR